MPINFNTKFHRACPHNVTHHHRVTLITNQPTNQFDARES